LASWLLDSRLTSVRRHLGFSHLVRLGDVLKPDHSAPLLNFTARQDRRVNEAAQFSVATSSER
jgi:hypothetical protein